MASLNSLQMRALGAQTTAIRYGEDEAIAIRIVHLGNSTSAISVVVAADHTLTLTDSVGGVRAIAIHTAASLGGLVDTINALATWKAKLLDSRRSQITSVDATLMAGTKTANFKNGEWGYDLLLSTTVAFTYPIRCTYDRSVMGLAPASGHRVKLVKFNYNLDVNAAAADKVQVWEWDPVLRTETQVYSAASVDSTGAVATGASHDFSLAPLTAKEGNDLIVLVTDATVITTDAADNFIQAIYVRE